MEIISSGIITVPAGVSSTGLYFIQEGVLQVVDKGWAQEIGLAEGGQAFVSSGGILYLCTVSSGGTVTVLSGGYAQDVTVENGGLYLVSSGGTAHKSLLKSGGTQIVRAGEMAASVTVMEGGVLHVSSGGYARNPVVSSGGFAYAWANALIDNAKVSGTLEVNANAAANSVSVLDGGKLAVLTGGYAYEAKISSGGTLDIASGGRANFTKIYESGTVMVSAGASCNNAEINGGTVTLAGAVVSDDPEGAIIPGGFASKTTVNSGGFLFISSGGTANSTTVNSSGRIYISSGGIADCTTLNSGGNMYISSGGTADSATVNEGGYLRIYSGGTATAIVENGGYVYVANSATVSFVENTFSGCVLSKASATVHSGTTAIDATVKDWAFLYVSSGGIVNSATIDVDGIISVLGGTVNSVTVNADGSMHIRDGGTADGTIMTGGGCLLVYSGGTATNIVWTPCEGYVNVYEGGYVTFASEYSGVYFGSGNKLLSSASVMDGKTLDDNFEMYVMNGGTADSTTVNYYGNLYVRDGGTAKNTEVNEGGTFVVSSGGTANSTTVNGGGMIIEDGGTADSITVNGGEFQVSAGGTAANIILASGGELYVYYGGVATGIVENGGYVDFEDDESVSFVSNSFSGLVLSEASATVHSGTTANSATVSEYGILSVHSGGIVKSTTVNEYGVLRVSSGGTADCTEVNGGEFKVSEGGMANGATVNCGGSMYVSAGGTATGILENGGYVEVDGGATVTFLSNTLSGLVLNYGRYATVHSSTTATSATLDFNGGLYVRGGQADHTTVNDGGKFTVSDDGRADSTTVNDGGSMIVADRGKAAGVAIHAGGNLEVGSGGSASDATVNDGGSAIVGDGGKATGVTIHAGGGLKVGSGGSASDATVNSGANMFVASNGTATDITVYAGGRLELGSGGTVQSAVISSGGIVTGYVDCHGITFDPGAELQLDLSVISPGNKSALVNLAGLAETPDCPSFTLPVSNSQDYGDYKLAENAWGFETKTISVYNSVADFGSLSLDRSVVVGSREYKLNLNDGDLILSVNATQPTQYVYLDFDGEKQARYSNPDLELSFDLSVADPAFSDEQRAAVVSALSEQYGKYNIAFTLERPEGIEFSTLYFGVSSAFDEYGDFFGIAETCDGNDQARDDNAFVLLDSGYSDEQIISVASHMLDHLMGFSYSGSVDGSLAILKYAESKALLSLSAGWNQEDPYNKYCPIYPVTGERCVVGCTNTAASQIIYYWMQNGLLDFTLSLADSDAYQSNRYIMIDSSDNPESGHLSFAETNKLLQSFNILDENCIAALCFAAGVVQQADYTSKETSTAWNGDLFIRAGFEKDEAAEQHESGMSYYDVLAYELLHGRPTGVSVRSQSHAIVADGYDSSRNMFHLDFGWGDETTRWYTVEEMDALRLYGGIYGYTPVASPDLTIEDLSAGKAPVEWKEDVTLTFTVSNDGKEMSEETMAYVYCGDAIIGACGIAYISPGYSRDFICTVNTASLKVGENVLTVKVDSQNDEGTVSSATCEVTVVDTTAPVIKLDADTETTVRQTTLTATVDDGSTIQYRIGEFGLWKEYKEPLIASLNETYYFLAMDDAGNIGTNQITFGNIDTSGILLSTLWSQRGINPMGGNTTILFNEYTPLDPSVTPEAHCLTGCVNTASGQLIYYFIEKGWLDLPLTLKKSDEYTSKHKATEEDGDPIVIPIKADGTTPGTLSFAEINAMLSDYQLDSAEHAAALLYAIGVVLESKYSANSTGTSWNRVFFKRAGFEGETMGGPYFGEYYWGDMDDEMQYTITDAGFEVLIENLEAGLPVGATYPGHAFVIDGYDRESDTFHINLGWGGNQATRWYTRDEMQEELNCEYFVYDLNPEYVETFTVTDARVYGTGTMIRAFERAAGMIGDNTVAFDPSVAGKTVELLNHITFFDEVISVKDFNMNVLVTESQGGENSYGFYADHLDVFEPTDPATVLTFHASGGSLIVSTEKEFNYAFQMEDGLSCTVDANGMLIYGGKYSAGAAVVLEALQVARSENTDVPDDLLDPNGWSYFGSAGNDVFSLSNLSIAVGNVSLDTGNDVLSLRGHSRLYGTIDAGDGDDSITVDSTSSISGDLSGKSKLSFVLGEQEDHALFTIKNSVSDLYSNATLSVDMTDAVIGTYTLFAAASGATGIEDLQNMVFTVTGSGSTLGTLAVGETLSVGGTDYTLKLADDVLSVAVSETGPAPEKAKWTYLMYFAADNDLDASALDDLISIQRANIDERIDVYVLVDRPEYPWDYEEGEIQSVNGTYRWDSLWTDTRVGKIRHDSGLTVTVDWESWGELDTGSAETLDRFVKWVQAESPAENYALVLWDHGEEFATLCYDFTTDPDLNACLTVSDVSEVVKTNGNIPLVIFNSCLNASDIATTQMAGSTDVMVAPESPSMSSGTTYAYRPFFSTITADMTAREMAEVLVRNVREATDMPYPSMLTAIDVTDTRLADSLKVLAEAVLASGNIEDQNVLINAMLTAPQRRCLYTGGKVMQSDLKDMILQAKADPGYSGTSDGFRSALASVESSLGAVVLDYRSAPGGSGYSIGFANTINVSEKYLDLGYTADKVDKIILNYLTTWYGSNPEWADLLHALAGTYLARNTGVRTAVFDVVDNPDLVDGKVVQVNELGCFSGRGETIDGVTLDGDVYFGFTITEADKSSGGIRVVNDAGVTVSVSMLAGNGSVLATGNDSVTFSDLAVGEYFLRLASETKCDVAFSFDADWLTGVDRFDFAGSGSNEKKANGNATPDTASVLGAGYYSGMLTSMGDSDFYQFVNTGTDQVRIAVESLDGSDCLHVRAFSPKGIPGTGAKYKAGVYTLTMSVGDRLFVEGDANLDKDQVNAYSITVIPYEETPVVLSNLNGTKDGASWEASEVDHLFRAEYSTDDFEHVLSVQTSGWGFDTPELPEGTYQWRVKVLADVDEEGNTIGEDGEWFAGNEIVSDNTPGAPKIVQSNADGNTDIFFASPVGTWNKSYSAQHVGTPGGWTGTNELISAKGKGRIQNLFFGSADVSTLYLTDSENGDALFVDDVYTGSPEGIAEKTARLFQISEIFAGAGDDIVDMTSQRFAFAYAGDLTGIHGGDGNDVIWANSGDNQLFGDAGDDRIVGSSGYDFIVGGIGNDRMHGGGGDDIFTFCENWGTDTVEQLADGSVLLWFASGSMKNWDADTLTYKDDDNSVTVSGVTGDRITLKFGNDWSMLYSEVSLAGGFLEFSSQRIFEESNSGILA